jgi:hypothetical protein
VKNLDQALGFVTNLFYIYARVKCYFDVKLLMQMLLVFASLPFRTSCLNVYPIPSVERLEKQIGLDNSIIFLFDFILGFTPSKICFMVKKWGC